MTQHRTLFEAIGVALYGPRHTLVMADLLGCNRRLVQKMAAGSRDMPADIAALLERELIVRRSNMADLLHELRVHRGEIRMVHYQYAEKSNRLP